MASEEPSDSTSLTSPSNASNAAAATSHAPTLTLQQLQSQRQQLHQQQLQLSAFWQNVIHEISQIDPNTFDFKTHQLPLARIKKIMKFDEDVRMISAEAPILFAKACEMFILEISLRAWIHTEENKRRTLQRSDIAMAITKTDMFDFLIDIVPRDDIKPAKKSPADTQGLFQTPFQSNMLQSMLQQVQQSGNNTQALQVQQQLFQQYQELMQAAAASQLAGVGVGGVGGSGAGVGLVGAGAGSAGKSGSDNNHQNGESSGANGEINLSRTADV